MHSNAPVQINNNNSFCSLIKDISQILWDRNFNQTFYDFGKNYRVPFAGTSWSSSKRNNYFVIQTTEIEK